jgi:hypothetical protein
LDDNLAAEIRVKMRDQKFKSLKAVEDYYVTLAREQSFTQFVTILMD